MTRRDRLIRFVDSVGGKQERFAVTVCRMQVSCAVLTDEALEELADEIRSAFWLTRRLNAKSRAIYAAQRSPVPFLRAAE